MGSAKIWPKLSAVPIILVTRLAVEAEKQRNGAMADNVHVHVDATDIRRKSLVSLPLAVLAVAAWLAAPAAWSGFSVFAAEVDAVGAPAPVGFAEIAERVKPAVVRVLVRIEGATPSADEQEDHSSSPGSLFDRFLHRFGIPVPDAQAPKSGMALGSGFFITADGYVVTNNHVVDKGTNLEVTTDIGRTYQAKVVGTDPQTDLALIKVSAGSDFSYVRLAADVPRIGDWVLAVGNPFGLGGTVTAGIVSARGRDIGAGPYDDFIQIDAPVNPGNSGGPTFNVRGEVIGVNTAIYSPSGGFVGVAFDIPAETVQVVIRQLRDKGHVTRGWIGVQTQPVTPAIAEAIGLNKPDGALIAQVQPASPAAAGGIEVGDVIVSVNGEAVKDSRDLAKEIATIAPGTATKLGIFRNGEMKTVSVTLGELHQTPIEAKAEEHKTTNEPPVFGVSIASARAVAGAGEHGVVITHVDPTGRAAESGLQTGDVILKIGNQTIDTPQEVRTIVEQARKQSKQAILLYVKRGDTMSFVAVPIG